jgi:hypothetical protein
MNGAIARSRAAKFGLAEAVFSLKCLLAPRLVASRGDPQD